MDPSQRINRSVASSSNRKADVSFPDEPDLTCIDLPGEKVKCWRASDQLIVVLRKHRDVIFDITLERGASYTVESSASPIYCDRAKKLLLPKSASPSFADGERFHIWLSRDFAGTIILRQNGRLFMEFEPKKFDEKKYDIDPRTKPVPIVIALGAPARPDLSSNERVQTANPERPASANVDDEMPIFCVLDGLLKDAPLKILAYFSEGGARSGLVDFDPFDIATRNWIFGQIAGAGAYVKDNWEWLRASLEPKTRTGFRLVTAKLHLVRGKLRIYFAGYTRQNTVFGPGGFSPQNGRVLPIFSGAGSAKAVFKATAAGALGAFKNCALVGFLFSSATAMAEWKSDIAKDGYDLAAALIMALLKTILIAFLTAVVVAIILCLWMVVAGAGLAVVAVGALTIVVGFLAGYSVDAADKKLGTVLVGDDEGLSPALADILRRTHRYLNEAWGDLKRRFPNDYQGTFGGRSQ